MEKRKKVFLLYGPPASGKTTIATFISEKLHAKYISIGSLTRSEIAKKTALGKRLKKYLDEVVEYPANLISTVVDKEIEKIGSQFNITIIDGFPKYESEVPAFQKMIRNKHMEVGGIFIIKLPLSVVRMRVKTRMICHNCLNQQEKNEKNLCIICGAELNIRDDDSETIIKRRYGDFLNSMKQLSRSLFPVTKNIIKINGNKSKADIKKELENILPE